MSRFVLENDARVLAFSGIGFWGSSQHFRDVTKTKRWEISSCQEVMITFPVGAEFL